MHPVKYKAMLNYQSKQFLVDILRFLLNYVDHVCFTFMLYSAIHITLCIHDVNIVFLASCVNHKASVHGKHSILQICKGNKASDMCGI